MKTYLSIFVSVCLMICLSNNAHADFTKLYSSEKASPWYAKSIIVETYIMSEPHIAALFKDDVRRQPDYGEIRRKHAYLVVSVKNIGGLGFWGVLECTVENVRWPIDLDVGFAPMPDFMHYVIPISRDYIFPGDRLPKITTKWKGLCAE